MKALGTYAGRMLQLARGLGPYAAIELLLPGGSMLALLYWWYRRRMRRERPRAEGWPFSELRSRRTLAPAVRRLAYRADGRSAESRPRASSQPRATPAGTCQAAAA